MVAALALGGRFALQPLLPTGFPFSTILIPVLMVSAVAGSGPGLLTFLLAGLPAWYRFGPTLVGTSPNIELYANLVLGALNNLAAVYLGGLAYTSRRRAESSVFQLQAESTKRQAAEAEVRQRLAELEEQSEWLRTALKAVRLVAWRFDPASTLCYSSEGAPEILGLPAGEFPLRLKFVETHVRPEDWPAISAVLIEGRQKVLPFVLTCHWRRPDTGTEVVLEVHGRSYHFEDGRASYFAGVLLDVTERRESEERRRQSAKMEAIGQLAGGLAHDFNNQLSALSGFAHFVARDPNLSSASRGDIDLIIQAADRMAGLTRQLLAFSRRQVLTPETVSLNEAVMEAQPLLQRLLGPTIKVRLESEGDPAWVQVDRAQLTQVLLNLAINARDAMAEGGEVALRVGHRIVAAPFTVRTGPSGDSVTPGTYAELTVTDNGVGIAPGDLGRIFEPFFTTKEVGQGTGLGLATVMGIVAQSHGHVWVESQAGRGARFTILFPEVDASLSSARPVPTSRGREPAAPPLDPARGQGLVLVVDDEPAVRKVISRILQQGGYQVIQAQHGEEALELLAAQDGRIRLVLSDVVMPVLGGTEFARQLALSYPATPVIWMSGYAKDVVFHSSDGTESAPSLNDARAFLQKPVDAATVLSEVRAALDSTVSLG